MAEYSQRHLDPAEARAYRTKFDRSLSRRLSHRRERALVARAVDEALTLLPPVLPDPDGPILLDLPCGAGRFSPLLAARAARYQPADHSPAMLALAREALEGAGLADRAAAGVVVDAREPLPFADRSFDLVCCIRLLHHFREPVDRARILSGLRRVARGPLVLTWLDAGSVKQRLHALRCALSGAPSRRAPLTRAELGDELRATGWALRRTWALSGLFSGQAIAVCAPSGPREAA